MKAIVTGSNGLLGSAIKNNMRGDHIYHTRKDCDLTNSSAVDKYFENISYIKNKSNTILQCGAKVGGVLGNMNNNKLFFEENIKIDENILRNAYQYDYENVVTILSTCIFPDKANYPLTIDQLDNGAPHGSNYGYSYAKRLLAYKTKIYREMVGKNWISIVPNNLYGEHDNFHLENAHLVPALIRKAYESTLTGENFIVWGNGSPLRQFTFSDDMAKIIFWAIDNWKSGQPLMAINEQEYSIKEVVQIITKRFNIPDNKIVFDTTKPSGQFRKPAKSDIPDWKFTSLEEGINKTIDWFIENYDNIRK